MTFYKELSRYYDIIFKTGKSQMALIQSLLISGSRILDIGSGTGTYSIPLARLGYRMVALDNDQDMIERLREKAKAHNLDIESFARDMMGLDDLIEDKYDGILCIGNTLPHLSSISEVQAFLKVVFNKLDTDGILILQTVNYDRIYKENITSLPLIDRPENGIRFERSYRLLDEASLEFEGTLTTPDGRVKKATTRLLGLKLDMLETALAKAGFTKLRVYGNFDEDEWDEESPATVILAYRN